MLTAPPPVRSLAISAGAAVIAAAMIVLGSALDLTQVIVFAGVGLMIFAVLLAVVALVLTLRLRTTGYTTTPQRLAVPCCPRLAYPERVTTPRTG